MSVLVGYCPDDRGVDALALAALVVRVLRVPLVVANVHPPPWPARGPGSVDAEWVAYLREESRAALDAAAGKLAGAGVPGADVTLRVHSDRGSGRGLIEVARDVGASLIVAGSAPRGRRGRIAIGSTADQLLHGSPVPVLLAPRGYADDPPGRALVGGRPPTPPGTAGFDRLTVAYWRRRASEGPLSAAAEIAGSLGVPLRLLTLVLRPPGLAAKLKGVGDVLDRQVAQADADLEHAAGLLPAGTPVDRLAVVGTGVAKTLGTVDMLPGEILACQSSHDGPLRKVFLGESSGKIVRAAPCPVLVLPRGAAPTERQLR